MALISSNIPNLINGISQQPYGLRLASQGESQINGYSSVVDGLRKRPSTRHIAKLEVQTDNALLHTINRDINERYVVVIEQGDIKVYDLEGNQKTVSFPDGKSYLEAVNPQEAFRCVTVADYTFILNTEVVVQSLPDTKPERTPEALVWVKQGAYGGTYKIILDGQEVASFTTPDGSESSHSTSVVTDYIATQLFNGVNANANYTVTRHGSTLWIRRADSQDFTITTDDPIGDTGLEAIKAKTQRFSSLPARAVDGYTVEIAGDQSSSFDNYYVKYEADGTSEHDGVWKETIKAGEEYALDPMTMPFGLVRESDGSFTFKAMEWAEREVGDLESNPFPSFTGNTLNDLFFHRNRLGFVSGENVVFSRVGRYFNFFIGTATTMLDDDPIDIGVSHTKVSILRHAIPFNETLLLFSDQTQFQLGSAEILTPSSVSINQTTEYECSLKAKPVGAGRYVYFSVSKGGYTGLREYYVDGETESEEAADITGHVPKLIPKGVFKLNASSNEDVLIALTENKRNSIYVYKYYFASGEKLQSAWSVWEFEEGDEVLNADFIESDLYLIIKRGEDVCLEVMPLANDTVEPSMGIMVHLDSLVEASDTSVVYDSGDPDSDYDDFSYITLPYKVSDPSVLQLVTGTGGSRNAGRVFSDLTVDNTGETSVVRMDGDWTNQPFFIGRTYTFRYQFSPLVIKEEAVGGGQISINDGRLQLRRIHLDYTNSGYFRAEVTPYQRDTYTYVFSGKVVGSGNNILGQVTTEQGAFGFPVTAKNDQVKIELVNDSYLPSYFLSASWEGFFHLRSRRL